MFYYKEVESVDKVFHTLHPQVLSHFIFTEKLRTSSGPFVSAPTLANAVLVHKDRRSALTLPGRGRA
jgi:hypothetical protein